MPTHQDYYCELRLHYCCHSRDCAELNNDVDEISYDLEEVFEDDNTLGSLIDYLVDNEKCEVWDTPYLTFLILNHPEKVYTYFEN